MTRLEHRDTRRSHVTLSAPVVELPASLARALGAGHPWVYRDHVPRGFTAPSGSWVRIRSGPITAVALWDADSPLALRIYSRGDIPDAAWTAARVRSALELRRLTGVTARTSAYRWIGGEGDGLPGITADRYGSFVVVTADSPALAGIVPWVTAALNEADDLAGVVRRVRGAEADDRLELLSGRLPPRELVVEENGIRFRANLFSGQKTGLFLDQRDNRHYIESVASGRRVLNLFGYTGGFSLYAARGGATSVTTVDIAEAAIADARENFTLNGFDPDASEFFANDVFEYLTAARERRQRFGVVVCDPPSFARSRAHRDKAIQAYVRLHAAGLTVTENDGLYAASSCTTQIGVEAFHGALAAAAQKARVNVQVVHDVGHAPDHPILPGHPEGRYLKFVVLRVSPRA
jgi:23S rRNA (cytosine1962-C5)-methyltransferase